MTVTATANTAIRQLATTDDIVRIKDAASRGSTAAMGASFAGGDQTNDTIDRNRAIGSTHKIKSVRVSDR